MPPNYLNICSSHYITEHILLLNLIVVINPKLYKQHDKEYI